MTTTGATTSGTPERATDGTVGGARQPDRGRFTRIVLGGGVVLLAVNLVGQVVASRGDDDPAVREAWLQDVIAVLIASLLFAGIAFAVSFWAMSGSPTRRARAVVGLSVLALLLVPVAWWSSAPALVALQAVALGAVTGTTSRHGGSSAARALSIVAAVAAIALFVFVVAVTVVEQL
jgi:hypothetical protein